MLKNKVNVKKRFKFQTDRFELTWHQLIDDDNERTIEKTVWEAPACYVGPEGYDSSSIDNIYNGSRNDVTTVINDNIEWIVCRRNLRIDLVKFKP
jgi:hypothetical protein